ncbi:MAG TPA: hypothetical protein VG711_10320 [Phycisphaerales bacterium]|nr:hypothetical protein [Phycisphaerales bacterium]
MRSRLQTIVFATGGGLLFNAAVIAGVKLNMPAPPTRKAPEPVAQPAPSSDQAQQSVPAASQPETPATSAAVEHQPAGNSALERYANARYDSVNEYSSHRGRNDYGGYDDNYIYDDYFWGWPWITWSVGPGGNGHHGGHGGHDGHGGHGGHGDHDAPHADPK